jgi:hypothetical protein
MLIAVGSLLVLTLLQVLVKRVLKLNDSKQQLAGQQGE